MSASLPTQYLPLGYLQRKLGTVLSVAPIAITYYYFSQSSKEIVWLLLNQYQSSFIGGDHEPTRPGPCPIPACTITHPIYRWHISGIPWGWCQWCWNIDFEGEANCADIERKPWGHPMRYNLDRCLCDLKSWSGLLQGIWSRAQPSWPPIFPQHFSVCSH